uniref:Transposase n=1 Tax=Heterorhabditis bacteriophora TaxID=37862 RepID=A0A1I7XCF3_HETBA
MKFNEIAFTKSAVILRNKNDPFLDRIVACDEKWILYDNQRRSIKWLDQDEAPKHIAKPKLHQNKVMVTKLDELAYETLTYPAYSLDLSSTNSHVFKHLDTYLQEEVFNNQTASKNDFRILCNRNK